MLETNLCLAGISLVLLTNCIQTCNAELCTNSTLDVCFNGGECSVDGTCLCQVGFSGSKCEYTVMTVVILVAVCLMPLITWVLVCYHGCRNWRAKARRRRRRETRARERARRREREANDGIPEHDDPPDYDQAVHSNPIAISGTVQNTIWTSSAIDYTDLPPHYDDLINLIKSASFARLSSAAGDVRGEVAEGASTSRVGDECAASPAVNSRNAEDQRRLSSNQGSSEDALSQSETPPVAISMISEPDVEIVIDTEDRLPPPSTQEGYENTSQSPLNETQHCGSEHTQFSLTNEILTRHGAEFHVEVDATDTTLCHSSEDQESIKQSSSSGASAIRGMPESDVCIDVDGTVTLPSTQEAGCVDSVTISGTSL